MLKISNKNYNDPIVKVFFGQYCIVQSGTKREGYSPFISFEYNEINIGIETTYDKNWFKELNKNDKKDISKYVSDITYEDENGWTSLINDVYKCYITKIEDNIFVIDLNCYTEELIEPCSIILNEKIEINFNE